MNIPFITATTETTAILQTPKGKCSVLPSQIIRVQAQSNYCIIYFTDGSTLVVAKVLAWFEQQFGNDFWRIHRSHLINRNHIRRIKICYSASKVYLNSGDVLPIAKRKKEVVRELMAG